jgi:DNA-binding NarL/FixJ family response regulator
MSRVLIIDKDEIHRNSLAQRLRTHQLILTASCESSSFAALVGESLTDVVVVNVSDISRPWLEILRRLQETCSNHFSSYPPLFLCTSRIKRDPQFQLALERLGVRFVYER